MKNDRGYSIDEIHRNIRQEFELRQRKKSHFKYFSARDFHDEPNAVTPVKNVYSLTDFLNLHDEAFVDFSYEAILGRAADAEGRSYYLAALRERNLTKTEIVGHLRFSPEGRLRHLRIRGLIMPLIFYKTYRIPVFGYLVRALTGIVRIPFIIQNFEQFESFVHYRFYEEQRRFEMFQRQLEERATHSDLIDLRQNIVRTEQESVRLASHIEEIQIKKADVSQLEVVTAKLREMVLQDDFTVLRDELLHLSHTKADQEPVDQMITDLREDVRLKSDLLARLERAIFDWQQQRQPDLPAVYEVDGGDYYNTARSLATIHPAAGDKTEDWFYYLFENIFYSSVIVREKQKIYLPHIPPVTPEHPFLDLGCGRGEFLETLHENHTPAEGVDINRLETDQLRQQGLSIHRADLLSFLQNTGTTFGGISALQVIEHLDIGALRAMLELSFRRLVSGGVIILETVNPHSAFGFSSFYMDTTHQKPIPPEVLAFMLEWYGFQKLKIIYSNLLPLEYRTTEIKRDYHDYAVIAYKP